MRIRLTVNQKYAKKLKMISKVTIHHKRENWKRERGENIQTHLRQILTKNANFCKYLKPDKGCITPNTKVKIKEMNG